MDELRANLYVRSFFGFQIRGNSSHFRRAYSAGQVVSLVESHSP